MKIVTPPPQWRLYFACRKQRLHFRQRVVLGRSMLLAASCLVVSLNSFSQPRQTPSAAPVVVQPGAPGEPSKTLPPSTRGVLPPRSQADVEFMQGMIMHHAQAVEMTALIASHTENQELRSL